MGLLSLFRKPTQEKALAPVRQSSGWYRIFESYQGAWQSNVTVDRDSVLTYFAVYACSTLIAGDIAKLKLRLMETGADGIKRKVEKSPFLPVLRKPNDYQTSNQFWENWILSKLGHGNAYVLKARDARGVVKALYVLDPTRVSVLVSDSGQVFYQLDTDNLAGLTNSVTVPAREIIHDRMNAIFHPLIGTSPIVAAGVAAMQGIRIQDTSANFFGNAAMPSGILSAPGAISNDTAARLKTEWETKFSGENAGRVAVVGDGLTFNKISATAEESQLIEQLKWTAETVCSVYHVPSYKVGIGEMPKYDNIQMLNVEYYSQCLQRLIEDAEACLDDGLGLHSAEKALGVEFDIDGLLRMDTATQMETIKLGVGSGVLAPNEGRKRLNLEPKDGGDSPYLQEQNYSLEALARRDAGAPAADAVSAAEQRAMAAEERAFQSEMLLELRSKLETAA